MVQTIFLGYGSFDHTIYTDPFAEPAINGNYSFPLPHDGTITDIIASVDLTISSPITAGNNLTFTFTVFKSSIPPNGNPNTVNSIVYSDVEVAANYAYEAIVNFDFEDDPGLTGFFSVANVYVTPDESLSVTAGDRIGIRVQSGASDETLMSNVSAISFNASLTYIK
jgi:hypothetical protein